MLCALCKEKEADKKNTHYLTDGIIRNCLNIDGSNERDKGFHFNVSNYTPFSDLKFQRKIRLEELEGVLGRSPTENEINEAKQNIFSVDNVFCTRCETTFTKVETEFIENILPLFRKRDLLGIREVKLPDVKLIRLFFYLQIWRTAICDKTFKVSEHILDSLRKMLLNHETICRNEINHFPLSIFYLETTGNGIEKTKNFVGYRRNKGQPNIIIMSDFVLQFYENIQSIKFSSFFGLNSEEGYQESFNYLETEFKVRVISNSMRLAYLENYIRSNATKRLKTFESAYVDLWIKIYGSSPSSQNVRRYLQAIVGEEDSGLGRLTKDNILKITEEYLLQKRS